jgi:tetratricopeptide (TPR) repeat protein
LFDLHDDNPKAQPQFEHALQLGRDTHSEYQEVKSLLKLGSVIYAQGNSVQGRALMQQGIDLAKSRGIDTYVKRGLVDMGNTFMLSKDYGEAEKYFKQSLELSQREKDPRNSARAFLSLASASERQDNLDQALSYIEQALPFYQRGGYRRETIRAFGILGRTKKKKGEYEAALEGFDQELKVAQFLGDQSTIALVNVDIGLLMMSQGRYPEALTLFEEGYRISKESKLQESIGLNLTNRANALWSLGRYNEAKPLLDEVSATVDKPEGRGYAAWYYLSASQMALSERKFAEAQKLAESAIKADSQPALTENAVMGLAQVLSGASQAGLASCQKALSMIKPATDPALAAEARLALAQALLQKGDNAGALKAALDSQQIFSRFGKQDSEWLALLIAARARKNDGDAAQARDFASRAETLLGGLQQKWGDTNYQSYLTRPDIQFYRSQLNELLAQKP